MRVEGELKGVGGWLTFFLVTFCAIGPAMMVSNTVTAFESLEQSIPQAAQLTSWANYKIYTWCVLALAILLRICVGVRLTHSLKRSSVTFTIVVLWILPVIDVLSAYLIPLITFGAPNPTEATTTSVEALKGALIAAIWTSYFLRSSRVRNTYSAV